MDGKAVAEAEPSSYREQTLLDLANLAPNDFLSKYLFDKAPFVFRNRQAFVEWKNKLSQGIEVDAAAITVVGSSAIGISLNPNKSFKDFDHRSDIDVAVISPFHFQMAWRFLRTNGHIRHKLQPKQKHAWEEHVRNLIFWGTIATDTLLPVMPFAKSWMTALQLASRHEDINSRHVNLRIYADYESLRIYQLKSARNSQAALLEQGR